MKYTCPMHPEIKSNKAGMCPKCRMKLVSVSADVQESTTNSSYLPLIMVVGLIFVSSIAIAYPIFNIKTMIESFMIGFFLVFAGFKLVDLEGFASGYSTYDLLAKRWFTYGYIYPFIELSFGLLMILGIFEQQVLLAEIIIMTFSGIGVALKLLKHEKFQCVCLGTFLKVPLTYVTLIEDFGMAILALMLLLIK